MSLPACIDDNLPPCVAVDATETAVPTPEPSLSTSTIHVAATTRGAIPPPPDGVDCGRPYDADGVPSELPHLPPHSQLHVPHMQQHDPPAAVGTGVTPATGLHGSIIGDAASSLFGARPFLPLVPPFHHPPPSFGVASPHNPYAALLAPYNPTALLQQPLFAQYLPLPSPSPAAPAAAMMAGGLYPSSYSAGVVAADRAARRQLLLALREQERRVFDQQMEILMRIERSRAISSGSRSRLSTVASAAASSSAAAAGSPAFAWGAGADGEARRRTTAATTSARPPPDGANVLSGPPPQGRPQPSIDGDGDVLNTVCSSRHHHDEVDDDNESEAVDTNGDDHTDLADGAVLRRRTKRQRASRTDRRGVCGATTTTGGQADGAVSSSSSSCAVPPPPVVPDTAGSSGGIGGGSSGPCCTRADLVDSSRADDVVGRRNQTLRLARSLPFDKKYYVLGRLFEEMSEREKGDIQKLLEQV